MVRERRGQGSKQPTMTPRAQTREQSEHFTMFGCYANLSRQRQDHVVQNLTSLRVWKQSKLRHLCFFF